jgi:hypothetical protein
MVITRSLAPYGRALLVAGSSWSARFHAVLGRSEVDVQADIADEWSCIAATMRGHCGWRLSCVIGRMCSRSRAARERMLVERTSSSRGPTSLD